jgi:anti-sigma B factor antagonist
MKLTTEVVGKITIISIMGDIDSLTSEEVGEILLRLLEAGCDTLVIDFEHMPFMSSIGLRVLLSVYQAAELTQTPVVLAAPQSGVEQVLDTTGFSSFLTCYDSVDDAIADLA